MSQRPIYFVLPILLYLLPPVAHSQGMEEGLIETGWKKNKEVAYEDAISYFKKALVQNPLSPQAYDGIIRSYVDWGWFEQLNGNGGSRYYDIALQFAHQQLDLLPDTFWTYRSLGYVYQFQGESQLALASFQKAARLNQKDARTWYHLWFFAKDSANLSPIQHPLYQKALELDSGLADLYLQCGDYYRTRNLLQQAVKAYEKYDALENSYLGAYNLGLCYYQMHKPDLAMEYFELSIEHCEHFCWSHFMKGSSLWFMNRPEEAKNAWNRAFLLNPQVTTLYTELQDLDPKLKKVHIDE